MLTSEIGAITNPWRLARLFSGVKSAYLHVYFKRGTQHLRAIVPTNELWVAVKDVLVLEEYEVNPGFRLRMLPKNSIVLDAGAFVGLYSLKASTFVKRVVALEPSRRNYALLAKNIDTNLVTNVESRLVALTSKQGVLPFSEGGTSSSVVGAAYQGGWYSVQGIGLNQVIEELEHVDLMKMDIEGSEYDVLENTAKSSLVEVDRLVAEVHLFSKSHYQRLTSVVSHLEQSGMKVVILGGPAKRGVSALIRPWRCSLERIDATRAIMYRLFIAGAYGFPFAFRLRNLYDEGNTALMFAYRK